MRSIVAVVGGRIGPQLLDHLLACEYQADISIGLTSRADISRCREIAMRHKGKNRISLGEIDLLLENIESGVSSPDWLVNLWGDVIFKQDVLERVGDSVNVHPGYLPYGRGSDPVVWSQLNRWPVGATLHRMRPDVDAGEIWVQSQVDYDPMTPGQSLYTRVLEECVRLFGESWLRISQGEILPVRQESIGLPTMKREDLLRIRTIMFSKMGEMEPSDILRWVAALDYGEGFRAQVRVDQERSYFVNLGIFHE